MKNVTFFLAISLLFMSCGSSNRSSIPLSENLPSIKDNYTINWVGQGQSYFYSDGTYHRDKANDYSFEVVQRRYGNTWKSIKNMHRIHPEYDGKAGDREQTLFFEIDFSKQGNQIVSRINSSLGNGFGTSDDEFRQQIIQFSAEDISRFAPFNTYRITQNYKYEEGILIETVELFKLEGKSEMPFAKIEEMAYIFRPTKLDIAPTRMK